MFCLKAAGLCVGKFRQSSGEGLAPLLWLHVSSTLQAWLGCSQLCYAGDLNTGSFGIPHGKSQLYNNKGGMCFIKNRKHSALP